MKRYTKILVKKSGVIKAIIDLDGKILTDDRKLRSTLQYIMRQDLVTQNQKDGKYSTSLAKVTNEGQLFVHLHNELAEEGYDVE